MLLKNTRRRSNMEKLKRLTKLKSREEAPNCLATSIAIMKCTGVWMPDDLSNPWMYKLFAVTIQTMFFYSMLAAEIGYIFTVLGDTERIVDAAVLLISHIVQGVKMLNICIKQPRIERIIQFINGQTLDKYNSTKGIILLETLQLATLVGQVMIASAGVTAVSWSLIPCLKAELSLPLKTAYPFNINDPHVFAIIYIYSSLSLTLYGVSDAAINYLASGLMITAGAHLDVLSVELQEIDKAKTDNIDTTVACIKYHQKIIYYVNELGSIFGLAIFCQFIATSAVICMTLYKITITTEPVELLTMIFYLFCVSLELLMYCYPGDLIINKSLKVADAAAPGSWSGALRSRRALLLCMMRAQRALHVNAGGIFRASLPTAAAVVRAAYSYYAVLQQKMDEKS